MARLNDAIPITIRGGEDLRGLDITVQNTPLLKIAGTVTNSIPAPLNPNGDGVQPTTVFFHLANRDLETPADAAPANNSGNISLALTSGPFEIPNVAPGSYEVLARVADPTAGTGLGFLLGTRTGGCQRSRYAQRHNCNQSAGSCERNGSVTGGAALPANLRIALTPIGGSARVALYTLVSTRAASGGTRWEFRRFVGATGAVSYRRCGWATAELLHCRCPSERHECFRLGI